MCLSNKSNFYSFVAKSGSVMCPAFFFFWLHIALVFQGVWRFHINFSNALSSSLKNVICTLIGISLSLQVALSNKDILTIIILPVQEHGISSCLCLLKFPLLILSSFHCRDVSSP